MTTTTPGSAAVLDKIPQVASRARIRDDGQLITVGVPAAELEALAHLLADTDGVRLADVFASEDWTVAGIAHRPDTVTLRLVWGLDASQRYLVVESAVEGERYPSLSDIAPAAFTEECEIYEQFGIRPDTDKPLNRLMLPPHAGPDFPRLGRPPAQPPAEVHAPHFVGGQAFEFPVGPVRQVGAESLYYGLVTSGEEVVDLYLFTWHKHRGMEWRLRGRTARDALFLVERLEGLSAVANAWAFAAAVESATGIQPPGSVLRVRAIALELERLYNHAAALAALCQTTGLSVGQSAAEIALERFLRVNAAAFGHRYLFGAVDIGGPGRVPDLGRLRSDLPGAYGELRRAADALLGTNSFVDRLEATGIVSAEQALRLGLVGPVARASGMAIDTRLDHPHSAQPECRPVLVTGADGDVLARLQVMLGEAAESVRLIGELAGTGDGALDGRSPASPSPDAAAGTCGLGWAESSRGESLAWVAFGDDGRIARARLRPAAARNWRGFDDACRSQNVFTDIPIIEASFWLTVAGTAR
jgi:Ni,Fe-hydrogenase III large subunit/NADH:ubiquinone oxidoreductase subunit C